MLRGSFTIPGAIFLILILVILPVSAYNVAVYGSNAGLDPDLHKDSMVIIKSVPGSAGGDLDTQIDQFTQSSVDIIVLGGEDSFTPSTAAKLEEAVARGAIMVVAYPCNHLLDATLPTSNGGTSSGGRSLELANPSSAESKEIFAGLTTPFDLVGGAPDKENAVPKNGAVSLVNFDDGMPGLVYIKYGNGYVIQWTTRPVPAYMDAETADTIVYRLITRLKPSATAPTTTVPATTLPPVTTPVVTTVPVTQPQTTVIPADTTPIPGPAATSGDVSVYSSPLGASILVDGKYYGTTPANLTGLSPGNHILRLALSGYYDYEGTIYIVKGETAHAFGILQPLNQLSSQQTYIPVTVVPAATVTETEAKGILENSSVLVALIGVITAAIAAAATIFSNWAKVKKEQQ